MDQNRTWAEWKAKFISVINNPVYDTTSDYHVQDYYQGMMKKLKIKPIHLARLVALYYDYRAGRAMPRFPVIPNNRFKEIIQSEQLAPLQFLEGKEIDDFLNRNPTAKLESGPLIEFFGDLRSSKTFHPLGLKLRVSVMENINLVKSIRCLLRALR